MRVTPFERRRKELYRLMELGLILFVCTGCILSFYFLTVVDSRPHIHGNDQGGYFIQNNEAMGDSSLLGNWMQQHSRHNLFAHVERTVPHDNHNSSQDPQVNSELDLGLLFGRKLQSTITSDNFDYSHHPFFTKFIILNTDMCKDSPVDILIYFHSAAENFQRRRVLRETWANTNVFRNISVRRIFVLAKPKDIVAQVKIEHENIMYGDILQGDFDDHRKNLTLKAIMAVRWITQFCSHARYIIKADDDVFVNIFSVVEGFISKVWKLSHVLMCHVKENGTSPIVRGIEKSWGIPDDILKGQTFYPRFCPGYMVLFSGDLAPLMYEASFGLQPIPVDDVYLFGLLISDVEGLNYINVQQNLTLNQNAGIVQYKNNTTSLTYVANSAYDDKIMVQFWENTLLKLTDFAKEIANVGLLDRYTTNFNFTFT